MGEVPGGAASDEPRRSAYAHVPVRVIELGGTSVGGTHGVRAPLLAGSIFYDKHSIVRDAFGGDFDEDRALALVTAADHGAYQYGASLALDLIAASAQAIERYVEFAVRHTTRPIMINASEVEVRLAGLAAAKRAGALGRCVYASVNEDSDDDELAQIAELRPGAVMVLAFDLADPTPDGACRQLEEMFLPRLAAHGLEDVIVDVGAMDPPSLGLSMRTITQVREQFMLPVGCAFSNCLPQWTGLRELGREWVTTALVTSMTACRAAGADFLHYGLIERSRHALFAAGCAEVFYGFAAHELDGARLPDDHALRRMFQLAPP